MGRHRRPEIRERLLEACTEDALARGLPDRLAPLAEAAGTSERMLSYHFGTRDGLLMDRDATGDRARTDRALADFVAAPERG